MVSRAASAVSDVSQSQSDDVKEKDVAVFSGGRATPKILLSQIIREYVRVHDKNSNVQILTQKC